MIVRSLKDLQGTERDVDTPNWASRRFLLASDGVGFSVNDTLIRAGTETRMWYRHHIEAVYCVGGEGTLEDLSDGTVYDIVDGTIYVLDGHEQHVLRAKTDLRLICVFTPPLTGREVHDEEGVYPLLAEA
ncbi:MAG: ectoine synthase [Dehalococcoidia bacterium]